MSDPQAPTDRVPGAASRRLGPLGWWGLGLVLWLATSLGGTQFLNRTLDFPRLGGDFMAYWCGARAFAAGEDPYLRANLARYRLDPGLPELSEKEIVYGGQTPFYYPVWAVYPILPFLGQGYVVARNLWLVWMMQGFFVAGALWAFRPTNLPTRWRAYAFFLFALWPVALQLGQPLPFVLCLWGAALFCWDSKRDVLAGALMFAAIIKPQSGLLPLAVMAVQAWRLGRTGVLWGMAGAAVALILPGLLVRPTWIAEMLAAPRLNPPPTVMFGPDLGCSFGSLTDYLAGSNGSAQSLAYCFRVAVALCFLGEIVRRAFDRRYACEETAALAVLASFFVSPYARHYDIPLLIWPLWALIAKCRSPRLPAMIVGVWLIGPALDFFLGGPVHFLVGFQLRWFWIPAALAVAWAAVERFDAPPGEPRQAESPSPGETDEMSAAERPDEATTSIKPAVS